MDKGAGAEQTAPDPAEEFFGSFSDAARERAERMYRLKRAVNGAILGIEVLCPIHRGEDDSPIVLDTIPAGSFRSFLKEHPQLECPKRDTVSLIVPADMEPSLWEAAPAWEKTVIVIGAAALGFMVLFLGVRGCMHVARLIGTSPKKYQTPGRRLGIVGEMQVEMAAVEELAGKLANAAAGGNQTDANAIRRELHNKKNALEAMIRQAKLRDKGLLGDKDVLEIERKLGGIRP